MTIPAGRILKYSPFALVIPIFILVAQNNFISHSEFWSISAASLLFENNSEALVLYYKPIFHLLLKPLYLFDLENWQHIAWARSIFGLVAGLSCLMYLTNIYLLTGSLRLTYFYLALLLSSPLYFYNIFRVRADLVAAFFATCTYTLITYRASRLSFKTVDFRMLVLLCISSSLCFLATPKSIYFIIGLFLAYTISIMSDENPFKLRRILHGFIVFGFAPTLSLFSFFISNQLLQGVNPYHLAITYFMNSWKSSDIHISLAHLWVNAKIHFASLLLCVISGVIYLLNMEKFPRNIKASMMMGIIALIAMVFHNEPWPYYLAQWVPYLFLLALPLLMSLPNKKLILATMIIVTTPFLITNYHSWYRSNVAQRRTIQTLDQLLKPLPQLDYYDATGILPRRSSAKVFLGPNDTHARSSTLRRLFESPPALLFHTVKLDIAQPELTQLLEARYTKVQRDIWLRSDLLNSHSDQLKIDLNLDIYNLFIFDYFPYTHL